MLLAVEELDQEADWRRRLNSREAQLHEDDVRHESQRRP